MYASLALTILLRENALKIEDIKLGTGEMVQQFDVVEALYTGSLMSGKVFDSNMNTGKPLQFQVGVGQVIKGWDQGFIGFKVNGERALTIPAALAYGDRAMGEAIPANSDLKFTIKLLRILPAAKVNIITPGTGETIKLGQFLECKFSIKLPSGKEIADPSKISTLQISRKVKPWVNQSIGGIKIGEKRKVVVPYQMAYGEKGVPPTDQGDVKAGSQIPPKSDLTIEVEALKFSD